MSEQRRLVLRGYRRVFEFERRLFRLDRWRIPYPHGVPLRGIAYFAMLELAFLLWGGLPLIGLPLALVPGAIRYLALPLILTAALMRGRIDGRPPHHVLLSLCRFAWRSRWLAGLEPCPAPGGEVCPLEGLTIVYDAREPFVVRGRIRGPASVTFRYPSEGWIEGAPLWVRDGEERRARARRYRVRRLPGSHPMLRGRTLTVPAGRTVVVE
jgi:hypothetical protein